MRRSEKREKVSSHQRSCLEPSVIKARHGMNHKVWSSACGRQFAEGSDSPVTGALQKNTANELTANTRSDKTLTVKLGSNSRTSHSTSYDNLPGGDMPEWRFAGVAVRWEDESSTVPIQMNSCGASHHGANRPEDGSQ